MKHLDKKVLFLISTLVWLFFGHLSKAQNTHIRGFANVDFYVEDDTLNFGFGEWDLFITSDLNDKFSFLGETVFKYSPSSPTHFSVGVERIIVKFNYKGNHSILFGKHHTPINYWNDSYHHGRVFFPTVDRPLLFAAGIIPIHTTGIAFQGLNLGNIRFGYNLMIGNGIGSNEISDNDKYKSVTAAVHIKPQDKLQLGISYYYDVISAGAEIHGMIAPEKVNQQLVTGSISHFGKKFEILTDGTFINNDADSAGVAQSFAGYVYAGLRLNEKWVPYVRLDYLKYQNGESYFGNEDTSSILAGIRYEITYLIVAKLEYKHEDRKSSGSRNRLSAQIAVGF